MKKTCGTCGGHKTYYGHGLGACEKAKHFKMSEKTTLPASCRIESTLMLETEGKGCVAWTEKGKDWKHTENRKTGKRAGKDRRERDRHR